METKELLSVLDMREDEQWQWAMDNDLFDYVQSTSQWSFECLAFRLRDEAEKANKTNFRKAIILVYKKVHNIKYPTTNASEIMRRRYKGKVVFKDTDYRLFRWFATQAKPIHWIIAALIAKGKAKDGKAEIRS